MLGGSSVLCWLGTIAQGVQSACLCALGQDPKSNLSPKENLFDGVRTLGEPLSVIAFDPNDLRQWAQWAVARP